MVSESFIIRAMTSSDVPAVGRLAGKLVALHYALDPERFIHLPNPEAGYGRYLGRELENPHIAGVSWLGRLDGGQEIDARRQLLFHKERANLSRLPGIGEGAKDY